LNLSSQTQHGLNNFPTLVSPPHDRSSLPIGHQKTILNQNPTNVIFLLKIYLSQFSFFIEIDKYE
jgi:hypothetical protein